ncbi:hypothetical protein K0M31_001500 [Melipona bicolor]|uniref:Uncharacterized protein n=1 Tax=Melipona bicolor TaxID=60889 RepID=A0AA40GFX5_9HYME|nr:hypothetical protein K0M31_001500 [Melipona bicolor]
MGFQTPLSGQCISSPALPKDRRTAQFQGHRGAVKFHFLATTAPASRPNENPRYTPGYWYLAGLEVTKVSVEGLSSLCCFIFSLGVLR